MTNSWILDVLADLKDFATANGMPHLAEQLEATSRVARREAEGPRPAEQRGPPRETR